jgi:hypothetical protein
MRKIILLAFAGLLGTSTAIACDICGGGLGNNYTGLLPNFNKRFIGVRYHFNQLYTQLDVNGNTTALSNKEKYHTAELWTAWNIGTRWRVMVILPYSQIQKYNYGTSEKAQKNGLGDINLSGFYNLFNVNSNAFTQSLWLGLGVKLPTGAYNKNEYVSSNSPNIYQLGTGSTDFTANVNYDIRLNNIGLNTNATYKMNTQNSDDYRYGNKLSIGGSLYYNASLGESLKIRPNIGILHESQQKDHTMGYKIDETGGYNTNLNVGLEANIKNIAVGFTYQTPASQHISKGRTELINKFLTHVTFTF